MSHPMAAPRESAAKVNSRGTFLLLRWKSRCESQLSKSVFAIMAEMSPRELALAGTLGARPLGPGLAYGPFGWLPNRLDVFGPVGALDAL